MVFHFLGHASHELAARVNLQHLGPSQRAVLVNRLGSLRNFRTVFRGRRLSFFETAGDVDGQRVFENLAVTREFVMWQKKKVRLMDRVRSRDVEFWPRDVAWRRKIDLPEGLFDKPLATGRCLQGLYFGGFSQFFDGRESFPVALGAVVDFAHFGIHHFTSAKL